jgi:protein gp37
MTKTTIEWATDVWNPVTGCAKVSEGCRHCYAERVANRFWGERKFSDVRVHEDRFGDPLRWRKPKRVFVNSMSDLFHESVPVHHIANIFAVMALASQHTFMVLTKRAARMVDVLTGDRFASEYAECIHVLTEGSWTGVYEPLKNVWLGVSAETQRDADRRIPWLLQTPAAVRFVSCEPLLGPVVLHEDWMPHYDPREHYAREPLGMRDKLDWVIVGGESGPGARPMHPDWARGLRDACKRAQVPFFFKQWGEWKPVAAQYGDDDLMFELDPDAQMVCLGDRGTIYQEDRGGKTEYWCGFQPDPGQNPWFMERVGKKNAGRELDGRTWDEVPA